MPFTSTGIETEPSLLLLVSDEGVEVINLLFAVAALTGGGDRTVKVAFWPGMITGGDVDDACRFCNSQTHKLEIFLKFNF